MTRAKYMRQLRESKRKETIYFSIIVILIFTSTFSAAYAFFVSKENDKIKEKIRNYNSDSKVYYLKKDIEKGDY